MSRSILARDRDRKATIIGALKAGFGPFTNLTTFESGPLTNPTTLEPSLATNLTTFEPSLATNLTTFEPSLATNISLIPSAKSNTGVLPTTLGYESRTPERFAQTMAVPEIPTQTMAVPLTEGGLHSTMFNDTSTTRSTLASRAATLSNSAINGTEAISNGTQPLNATKSTGVTSTKTTKAPGSTGWAGTMKALQSTVSAETGKVIMKLLYANFAGVYGLVLGALAAIYCKWKGLLCFKPEEIFVDSEAQDAPLVPPTNPEPTTHASNDPRQ